MSIVAKRMVFVVGSFFLLATIGFVAASIVEYKPWGVHDLEREEYDQILADIDERIRVEETSRPTLVLMPLQNPPGLQLPGAIVETSVLIANRGTETLICDPLGIWPAALKPLDEYPAKIEPGSDISLRFEWRVPNHSDQLAALKFELQSNDPLNKQVEIEPTCEIAKSFFLAQPTIHISESTSQSVHQVNYVFSQRFEDFVITDTKSDARLVVEVEPISDPALLIQHQAKSGLQVSVTDPAGRRKGTYSLPIEFTALSDDYSENLSFELAMRRRSSTTFFGPELDVRSGLQMGVIEVGSDKHWSFFARLVTSKPLTDLKLEVQPEIFEAEIVPARKDSNDYKITLRLKKDAKPVDFQVTKKGYVKLSSKEDASIENGLPIRGVLIHPPAKD